MFTVEGCTPVYPKKNPPRGGAKRSCLWGIGGIGFRLEIQAATRAQGGQGLGTSLIFWGWRGVGLKGAGFMMERPRQTET